MMPPPRTGRQRRRDALRRLEHDVDAWVATASADGGSPYLVPLSFLWDGATLLVATPSASPTGRNLQATGRVRLGLGRTRDVVLIEGTTQVLAPEEVTDEIGDAFAAKTGFDPRALTASYRYFRIRPQRLQSWRKVNELADRDLMRDGRWLAPDDGRASAEAPGEGAPPDGSAYEVQPVGRVESSLTDRGLAPKQGDEGAPPARIVFRSDVRAAAADLHTGDEVLVVTWLHQGHRDVLSVHPRGDTGRPRTGVFSTRAPDRPNPIGLHAVTITAVQEDAITVDGLEAIDGTPVVDVKPILGGVRER